MNVYVNFVTAMLLLFAVPLLASSHSTCTGQQGDRSRGLASPTLVDSWVPHTPALGETSTVTPVQEQPRTLPLSSTIPPATNGLALADVPHDEVDRFLKHRAETIGHHVGQAYYGTGLHERTTRWVKKCVTTEWRSMPVEMRRTLFLQHDINWECLPCLL